jgi:hypothetical protein
MHLVDQFQRVARHAHVGDRPHRKDIGLHAKFDVRILNEVDLAAS